MGFKWFRRLLVCVRGWLKVHWFDQRRPSPLRQWCISLLFQIPLPISENNNLFSDYTWKILQILPFPKQIFDFHPPKFLMTFVLVINYKCSPYSACFSTFPSYFAKIIISPSFRNVPPVFVECTCILHRPYFMCISFVPLLWPWCIYASHNTPTGRPWTDLNIPSGQPGPISAIGLYRCAADRNLCSCI